MYDFYHNQANRRRRIIKVASPRRLREAASRLRHGGYILDIYAFLISPQMVFAEILG